MFAAFTLKALFITFLGLAAADAVVDNYFPEHACAWTNRFCPPGMPKDRAVDEDDVTNGKKNNKDEVEHGSSYQTQH